MQVHAGSVVNSKQEDITATILRSRPYRDAQGRLLRRDKTVPACAELIMSQTTLKM